jgi:hypothetical protein
MTHTSCAAIGNRRRAHGCNRACMPPAAPMIRTGSAAASGWKALLAVSERLACDGLVTLHEAAGV